jgi:hypothetical protein
MNSRDVFPNAAPPFMGGRGGCASRLAPALEVSPSKRRHSCFLFLFRQSREMLLCAFLRLDFLLVAIRCASTQTGYVRITNITIFNYTDSYFEFVVFGPYLQTNGEFLV